MASKTQTYLAKPVQKKMGSRIHRDPPAPTPYAQAAVAESSGATDIDTLFSAMGSKDGFAETVDLDFPTLRMFRRLGAHRNALNELKGSH